MASLSVIKASKTPERLETLKQEMAISNLPPEVVGEIFCHCSASWPDAPLTLSLVSRSFYGIAVATPRAWTYLQLFSSSDETDSDARCVRKAEHWFSRAGATSLYILVDISRNFLQATFSPFNECTLLSPLPLQLRRQTHRIESLTLRASTSKTAHHFLSTVYDMNSFGCPYERCLRNLTLDITRLARGGSHATDYGESPNPGRLFVSSHFTSFRHLEITNHALSYLLMIDLSQMETLVITGPLRAAPLAPSLVLGVLRRATKLARLELESRLNPDNTYLELLSPQTEEAKIASGYLGVKGRESIIILERLGHLSLRTNHVPAILSHLVLPRLQTLRIEDIDGRRRDAAYETGLVLRHLLKGIDTRGDDGCSMGIGLKELDLVGVGLQGTGSKCDAVDDITVKEGSKVMDEADSHLRWCFRKMTLLRRLRAKNVNVEALFGLLLQARKSSEDSTAENLLPCPNLQTLCLLITQAPTPLLADFQEKRPDVALIIQ